ncbi:MAG: polyhydroxyalkanoic acid system family protein [Betaproteobacteria bacterium]|jgi:putative polyhydroxyalkanoate system protein|nr:polyhydroxyalkanoic acid system family protein [Rubrivivax sp.]
MATIDVERAHSLAERRALELAQQFVAQLAAREGLTATWRGNRCDLRGTSLKGELAVDARHVRVQIDLGLPMRPFAGFVRKLVNEGLDGLAEAARAASPVDGVTPDEKSAAVAVTLPTPIGTPAPTPRSAATVALAWGAPSPLPALLEQFVPGRSLPQGLYLREDVFQAEMEHLHGPGWHFVDHASRLPRPGDWITHQIGAASLVVVRGDDDTVRAFHNVCPHRGSMVCLGEQGHSTRLVCPYHAWSFDLHGRLQHARAMDDEFSAAAHGLRPLQVRVIANMVYVSLSATPKDIERPALLLGQLYALHGLDRARVAHREVYRVAANWKLVSENFLECYHCTPTHPEYCSVNAHAQGNSSGKAESLQAYQEFARAWASTLVTAPDLTGPHDFSLPHEQEVVVYRQPIRQGFRTLSRDGAPVAPLMGGFLQYDGGESVVAFGATHFVSAANDHATVFRFTPVNAGSTEVVVTWLVDQRAEPGRDYKPEEVAWMWRVTTEQDKRLAEDNHRGVTSPAYRPGPYSLVEGPLRRFTARYVDELQRGLARDPASSAKAATRPA